MVSPLLTSLRFYCCCCSRYSKNVDHKVLHESPLVQVFARCTKYFAVNRLQNCSKQKSWSLLKLTFTSIEMDEVAAKGAVVIAFLRKRGKKEKLHCTAFGYTHNLDGLTGRLDKWTNYPQQKLAFIKMLNYTNRVIDLTLERMQTEMQHLLLGDGKNAVFESSKTKNNKDREMRIW